MRKVPEVVRVEMHRRGLTEADLDWAETALDKALERRDVGTAEKVVASEAFRLMVAGRAIQRSIDVGLAPSGHSQLFSDLFAKQQRGDAHAKVLRVAVSLLCESVEKLSSRLAHAEAQLRDGGFKYLGSYSPGVDYQHGQFVTHGGSIWFCNSTTPTRAKPGSSDAWTLSVKRGADGRDAR